MLLGVRSVAQLEPALGALDVVIDDELRSPPDSLSSPPPPATDRNEERSDSNFGRR